MDDCRHNPGPSRRGRGAARRDRPRSAHLRRDEANEHAASGMQSGNGSEDRGRGRYPSRGRPHASRDNRNQHNFRRDDDGQEHGDNNNQRRHNPRKQYLGFKRLEEIANSDSSDTLTIVVESRKAFAEMIESPIERPDVFVVILKIIAKVCRSSFDETKSRLLLDVCNSNYIVSFKSYLLDLPYMESKASNNMYWKNKESQETFWRNFVEFCECVVNTSPTVALNKCRSLVDATTMCLDGLKTRHGFTLSEECNSKLIELKERLVNFEKRKEEIKTSKGCKNDANEAPPEDFRELSITPTRDDLLHTKPFLRPNIVNGGYQDVEHYLDVQFRLLREDCFGPLRDGLGQYLRDQTKKRYDNIRVFRNVKFVKPYVSHTKVGSLAQIDVNTNKMFKRINWSTSKRFIFGSLVLFTKDNCRSFIVATILDRDEAYLVRGMIPVSILGQGFNAQLYNDDIYTMIESEVYFEPYFHVLKVLKDPTFAQNLPMKQYIVDVNPNPQPPQYLTEDTVFAVETVDPQSEQIQTDNKDLMDIIQDIMDEESKEKVEFTVLQDETWPSKKELSFNDSQYDAYKLSLTHEFAVVQGPPGTGKTYLGIKVAKTLFENFEKQDGCLMLVICYTNHALDQFLEALLGITDSIVRIGGQSRSEAMKQINLTELRRNISIHSGANQAFYDRKLALKDEISKFQKVLITLDVYLNGVIKCKQIEDEVVQLRYLCDYYKQIGLDQTYDPLYYWLFEHVHQEYRNDDIEHLFENTTENDFVKLEKENRSRTGVMLDDQDIDSPENKAFRKEISSFNVEDISNQMKQAIAQYKKTQDNVLQQRIRTDLQWMNSYKMMFNEMTTHRERRSNIRIRPNTNFAQVPTIDRWSLYFAWIRGFTENARNIAGEMQEEVSVASELYEEARMMMDTHVLRNKKIVGMTTSGAARMRKLLKTLNPPIVIVEEAAEVLEQHIITSLTEGCKHLILIGDHQQLRPSASHMKLAKHFQLEVSLFERMISNGIHSRRLSVQHRMRPEISALICPHIYQDIENHQSVYDFPDVKGMTKNLFFFSHDFKEEVIEDNMSRTNHREADITLGLANYLMQQGYQPEDITVLAAYKGQMFYMRKQSDNYTHLRGVKITVVDNYQGEESKIILLSLVRNNDENKIGFLGTANRICVALSRAKHGFYIFGNIETLKENSELWKNISVTLEDGNSLGTELTLRCQSHTDNITIIEKLEDFDKTPEGGCLLHCNTYLPKCGHKCLLLCHGYDREHNTPATRCTLKCERIQCVLEHICPKRCAEDCGPCMRKLLKQLPCGHEMEIFCHQEPDDPKVKCLTIVDVTLQDCKHQAKKRCHEDVEKVRCPAPCEFRVEKCGHSCTKRCHVKDDPDHVAYECRKPCPKAKDKCRAELVGDRKEHQCHRMCFEKCENCEVSVIKKRTTCGHKITTQCYIDPDTVTCTKKCTRALSCGHHCKKLCKEPCGDCKEMVMKTIPGCNHTVKMKCMIEPKKEHCNQNCERTMSCGHRCKGLCGNACLPSECIEPSVRKVSSPCGHVVTLPCNVAGLPSAELTTEMLLGACMSPCHLELACGHVCGGTCAHCHQGRLHVPCRQPCSRPNICGHDCVEPCNQICPPCNKKCEVKCKHSKCKGLCGAPCTPCTEKCGRVCPHGACSSRCGEPCSRKACDENCQKSLECGHPCRGLCGEPCPQICNICKPDDFPKDFLGDDFEDTDRFVLLQDCGHILEVENMDNLMMGDSEEVKIRCCPFCRKPIINTGRYKDLVNATFKNEINPIKEKVYGTTANISATRNKLKADLGSYRAKYTNLLLKNQHLKTIFLNLSSVIKTQSNESKLQLDMELVCLNILDMISECNYSYQESNATELQDELIKQLKLICKIFVFKTKKNPGILKISEQQQKDVKLEIKRLNAIVQLAKLTSHEAYKQSKITSIAISDAYKVAIAAVFKPVMFEENEAIAALKKLQEVVKVSGVVTKQERDLIVKAMGLKQGHWFKCPNGHIYCIADCGGAVQRGNCIECGAQVGAGGTSYNLAQGNRPALEVDGASRPAYQNRISFVLLQDCGHVLEVEDMDNLMMGDKEEVTIRGCPTCRKPIINTGRYKDLVNATFKNEINPIKEKVYGTKQNINATLNKLRAKAGSFRAKYTNLLLKNQHLRAVFQNLNSVMKSQAKASKLQLDMELICLNILDMISECYDSYMTSNAIELNDKMEKQLKLICKIFVFKTKKTVSILKISEQQQNDVKFEIKRLNAMVQLAKLTSHDAYKQTKNSRAVMNAYITASAAVFKPALFKENETIVALKKLQESVKVSGVVTKQERDLIVRAIGLKQGHWYKCPNGHFYCIADCGGAMVVSKCIECGASVGGENHKLTAGNAHASEMDGSKFAAWSEEYNNMANFEL